MGIRSYVALGDSFTEGLDDLTAAEGGYRGWADRFAERLADLQPGLRYANLAVRGKVLREVADEQVPRPSPCGPTWSASRPAGTTCSGPAPTRTCWPNPSMR